MFVDVVLATWTWIDPSQPRKLPLNPGMHSHPGPSVIGDRQLQVVRNVRAEVDAEQLHRHPRFRGVPRKRDPAEDD
jgi:hypothetical protein